jgi:hypothetical protein
MDLAAIDIASLLRALLREFHDEICRCRWHQIEKLPPEFSEENANSL